MDTLTDSEGMSFDLTAFRPEKKRYTAGSLLQYHDLILCIVSALEARDPYTSYHSSRVAEMTEAICGYIGLDAQLEETFHIAAHLHDIGKIGIRDNILLKQGKLNESEWKIMQSHSEQGYRILVNTELFREVATIVRYHHERYDGKGYPAGLVGKSIPLGARIIAIADSIDAMMSDRPYRRGLSGESCRKEIEKNSGIMYDPDITKTVLEHWSDLLKKREDEKHSYLR